MPCFRCAARQTDPARGASPWRRAVVAGEQVLVCPRCQADGVDAELDRCAACGSQRLAKALGDVMCRDCGRSGSTAGDGPTACPDAHPGAAAADGPGPGERSPDGRAPGLSDEVAAAIDRVLRRGPATM
jgi:hypothetical protein